MYRLYCKYPCAIDINYYDNFYSLTSQFSSEKVSIVKMVLKVERN